MNKTNNPIIFDFDYTLFGTAKFKEETIKNLASLGVTKEIYYQTYSQIRSQLHEEYLPNEHLKIISQKTGADLGELQKKYYEVTNNCQKYLYNDTIPFLDKHTKQKIPIYLLTFGNPTFHKLKIAASGIEHYFKKTLYTNKDKIEVASRIPSISKATFINDNPYEIQSLQKLYPKAKFIQITRENGKKFDLELESILLINNLSKIH